LVIGSLLGLAVFVADWYKEYTGWNVQFMMAAFYLFVICSVVLVATSLLWPHEHTAESQRLVWRNPLEALRERGWNGLANYRLLAGLLFAIMVLLYLIFATESTQRFFGLIR
jgi:SSS family solute:Na+ symporter